MFAKQTYLINQVNIFKMRFNTFKTNLDQGVTYLFPIMFCFYQAQSKLSPSPSSSLAGWLRSALFPLDLATLFDLEKNLVLNISCISGSFLISVSLPGWLELGYLSIFTVSWKGKLIYLPYWARSWGKRVGLALNLFVPSY